MMGYRIDYFRDDEANVWIATSDDLPGLVLESESFEMLKEHVMNAVPELSGSNDFTVDFHHANK